MSDGEQRETLKPIDRTARRARRRLTVKGELALALFPTATILIVLALLEAFSRQRLLFVERVFDLSRPAARNQHGSHANRLADDCRAGRIRRAVDVQPRLSRRRRDDGDDCLDDSARRDAPARRFDRPDVRFQRQFGKQLSFIRFWHRHRRRADPGCKNLRCGCSARQSFKPKPSA